MRYCYIDESGDTGLLQSPSSAVQPLLVVCAAVVTDDYLAMLTQSFINLKRRFSPHLSAKNPHRLNQILREMKGNELRRDVASSKKKEVRRAIGFLDRFMEMLEYHRVKIFGRVWIKEIGRPMDGRKVFAYASQHICTCFQNCLVDAKDRGMVICDSKTPQENQSMAHAIFTQKFKTTGDPYSRICEIPTFGHSNNHVGLQIADILASGLIYPMAANSHCRGHMTCGVHVKAEHQILRDRYGSRLEKLQFHFVDENLKRCGGITVSDGVGKKSGAHIFRDMSLPILGQNVTDTAATEAPNDK